MSDLDDDLIKLWRAPVPDRMAKACMWPIAFVLGTVILMGVLMLLSYHRFSVADPRTYLPYGCTVEQEAPNGECL